MSFRSKFTSYELIEKTHQIQKSLSIHIGSGGPGAEPPVRGSKNIAPFNVDREAFDEFFWWGFWPKNSLNG